MDKNQLYIKYYYKGVDNLNGIEKLYGDTLKTVLWLVNPVKKIFIKTACEVHIFINNQGFEILKNDGYVDAYNFLTKYKSQLNSGVVWADQDLKSREHFYNPYTMRGLYGCSSSNSLFKKYYSNSIKLWKEGNREKSVFYLGAALHLIQDSTIPQHANIKLLNNHRSYEKWIKRVHDNFGYYCVHKNGVYYDDPYKYIEKNSMKSISIYNKYSLIKDRKQKYSNISYKLFPLAQRTTAGCMLNFYNTLN